MSDDSKTIKSALKGSKSTTTITPSTKPIQFRIFVGSYEHNLLCLSVILDPSNTKEPVFQPIFHFQAHSLSIKSMDLAKRYLVTGSNDEHIRIYDLQKRKELGTLLSHTGTITSLRFSTESESTENIKTGKWLLSGSEDGKINIWRTKDWELFGTLKGHTDKINDLSIHPSGRVAISVSQDQTIRLWNLMTAKKAAILKIKGRDHLGQSGDFVKWSPNDGKFFLIGMMNQILIYNTNTAKIVKKIKIKTTLMAMEILTFDGKSWLVVGLGNGAIELYDFNEQVLSGLEDDENKVWDSKPEELEPEFTLRGHTNRIKGLSFIQDKEETQDIPLLVSVSSDGKIVIWNLTLKDQIAVYDTGERLNCVVTSPEGVEKTETMKRRFTSLSEMNAEDDAPSESEYETDGEEIKKIMQGKKNKKKGKKNNKKRKVTVTLE
ncbi:MAK11 Protein MAK11 [Candida maltosa Xu316]